MHTRSDLESRSAWLRRPFTSVHLRCALTATMTFTLTPACPTDTMGQATSRVECLLASGRGAMAIMAVRATMRDVVITTGAAMIADPWFANAPTPDADRPSPGTRNSGPDAATRAVAAMSVV